MNTKDILVTLGGALVLFGTVAALFFFALFVL